MMVGAIREVSRAGAFEAGALEDAKSSCYSSISMLIS